MVLISIIVPVYNVEKYIHRCVDSILSQTFRDFELIIINDCSTDSTAEILERFAQRESKYRAAAHVIVEDFSSPEATANCILSQFLKKA
mgnify:CR=1 FL=1